MAHLAVAKGSAGFSSFLLFCIIVAEMQQNQS